jgi:hypothetical protein
MYVLDAVAFVLITLYAAYYQFNSNLVSFFSAVPSDITIILIFILIVLSFVFAFLDLARLSEIAQQKAEIINQNRPAHKIQR